MEKSHSLKLKPIGIIHSPYEHAGEAPYQGYNTEKISQIEVFKEFEEGLQGIEGLSHITVIYWFHQSHGYHLLTKTPWAHNLRGLFTTRSPHRPCPLGLTVVELVATHKNILNVKGLDAIDGTPLLDIKPHIPEVDGWSLAKTSPLERGLGRERC